MSYHSSLVTLWHRRRFLFIMLKILLYLLLVTAAFGADCQWDKDTQYPTPYPPLVMDPVSWTSVLPTLEGSLRIVTIVEGATVILSCPQTVIGTLQQEVVEATCVGDTVLLIGGQEYTMAELGCTDRPSESLQKNLGSCGAGGQLHAIGFDVTGYGFYQTIEVCFDHNAQTTLYAHDVVRGAHIAAKDVNPDRPSFKTDSGFFTVSANTCYEQNSQIDLMNDILGDSSVIDVDNSLYFARGHMAPDADFASEQEQDATYYYINAVPQWQTINNGNWKELEFNVRDLAANMGRDLDIWSGGFQVLALDDVNSNSVDIYLGLTEGQSVLPAPDITWKVVYDEQSNTGAAVVCSNNPYLSAPVSPLCGSASFCDQLSWLAVTVDDIVAGSIYCCTVQELNNVIPSAPDLGNAGLLT